MKRLNLTDLTKPVIEPRSSSPQPSHFTDWATPFPSSYGNHYI